MLLHGKQYTILLVQPFLITRSILLVQSTTIAVCFFSTELRIHQYTATTIPPLLMVCRWRLPINSYLAKEVAKSWRFSSGHGLVCQTDCSSWCRLFGIACPQVDQCDILHYLLRICDNNFTKIGAEGLTPKVEDLWQKCEQLE
jgi:hypothetical protein